MPISDDWIHDLLQLKRTPRAGWFGVGVQAPESVADHCFAMALVGWRIARDVPGIDAVRVALMALLHDFAEARLTDIPAPAKKLLPDGSFEEAEREVVADQWGDDEQARELLAEFLAGETEEAKLAAACDNLEFLIQAGAYGAAGHRLTGRMLARAKNGAAWNHPVTKPYVERILSDAAGSSDGGKGRR